MHVAKDKGVIFSPKKHIHIEKQVKKRFALQEKHYVFDKYFLFDLVPLGKSRQEFSFFKVTGKCCFNPILK